MLRQFLLLSLFGGLSMALPHTILPRQQEFLLLPGVASQIQLLRLNIAAHPDAAADLIRKIWPDLVAIFDVDKSGDIDRADLMMIHPIILQYNEDHVAGKLIPLDVEEDLEEFLKVDADGDDKVSVDEAIAVIAGDPGSKLWNSLIQYFVAAFDSDEGTQGYLSPAERRAISMKIMFSLLVTQDGPGFALEGTQAAKGPLLPANNFVSDTGFAQEDAGEETEKEGADDKGVISVPNKMELLRKRFADPENLDRAAAIITRHFRDIVNTADFNGDEVVTAAEAGQAYDLTKDYLERVLDRPTAMVDRETWDRELAVDEIEGTARTTPEDLVRVMTTGLTGRMWESFMACVFNLAIDTNQDGMLDKAELREFGRTSFYELFRLPLDNPFL